jgi:hypothetical protein
MPLDRRTFGIVSSGCAILWFEAWNNIIFQNNNKVVIFLAPLYILKEKYAKTSLPYFFNTKLMKFNDHNCHDLKLLSVDIHCKG